MFTIKLSFSDPGFVSKGVLKESEFSDLIPIVSYNDKNFLLRYCHSCSLIRDVRMFHCKKCGLCVMRHGKTFKIDILNRSPLSLVKQLHRKK